MRTSSRYTPGQASPFHWRVATEHEAVLAYEVHLAAIADAAPGTVRPDELSHFNRHVDEQGVIVACFVDSGEMISYGILGLASPTSAHIATLLNLRQEDLAYFALFDGVATLPAWRGNRLHRESIQARLKHVGLQQRSLIGATVSPDNLTSLRSLLEAGFRIRNFAHLYGGLTRLVMLFNLHTVETGWTQHVLVDAQDLAGHQHAIAMNWIGYALSETAQKNWQVHYGTKISP